jgi:hypothetical protein
MDMCVTSLGKPYGYVRESLERHYGNVCNIDRNALRIYMWHC